MQIISNFNSSFQTFKIDAFTFIDENPQVRGDPGFLAGVHYNF